MTRRERKRREFLNSQEFKTDLANAGLVWIPDFKERKKWVERADESMFAAMMDSQMTFGESIKEFFKGIANPLGYLKFIRGMNQSQRDAAKNAWESAYTRCAPTPVVESPSQARFNVFEAVTQGGFKVQPFQPGTSSNGTDAKPDSNPWIWVLPAGLLVLLVTR